MLTKIIISGNILLLQICNYKMRILNINAQYPGATHDAFIWRNSIAKHHMVAEYHQGRYLIH